MIYHKILENDRISLRALEPEDVDVLFKWENNTDIWHVSSTITPFSKDILKKYIQNSDQDIYSTRQLRLMIDAKDMEQTTAVGAIDLYDFDPIHHRAGVGILINEDYRKKNYASEALEVLIKYGFQVLNLHQLYCSVPDVENSSIAVFEKANFEKIGVRKEWLRTPDGWVDEIDLQLLNDTNSLM